MPKCNNCLNHVDNADVSHTSPRRQLYVNTTLEALATELPIKLPVSLVQHLRYYGARDVKDVLQIMSSGIINSIIGIGAKKKAILVNVLTELHMYTLDLIESEGLCPRDFSSEGIFKSDANIVFHRQHDLFDSDLPAINLPE